MQRLVIAIDCDDVLVSTTPFFVEAYNREHGTSVTLDNAHYDDTVWGVERATLEARFAQLMETDEYKGLRPAEAEIEILKELSSRHELHVITARRPHERELTQNMLDEYLPGVFASLELVGFSGSKGEVCKRIGADVLVDDNSRHLQDAINHGMPKGNAILFGEYPWNMRENQQGDLVSCGTWTDVMEEIDELARA